MVAMSFFSSITLSACSIVGIRSGTEEPRYTVLQSQGPLKSASMVHGSHSAAPMAPLPAYNGRVCGTHWTISLEILALIIVFPSS
jgi:hypothetical protein